MSDFLNKYPYTDFHELNLDWVIERVKKLTEDWAATLEEWNSTEEQWQQLYDYVHDYFDNLDVQQEINNKINAMIADGTFVTITTPVIEAKVATMVPGEVTTQLPGVVTNQLPGVVTNQLPSVVANQIDAAVVTPVNNWLAVHITQPTTPAIDTSLSIPGAAADAAVTGERIGDCDDSIFTLDTDLYNGFKIYADIKSGGWKYYKILHGLKSGVTYDFSVSTVKTYTSASLKITDSSYTSLKSVSNSNTDTLSSTYKPNTDYDIVYLAVSCNFSDNLPSYGELNLSRAYFKGEYSELINLENVLTSGLYEKKTLPNGSWTGTGIPIKLEQGKTYHIEINTKSSMNSATLKLYDENDTLLKTFSKTKSNIIGGEYTVLSDLENAYLWHSTNFTDAQPSEAFIKCYPVEDPGQIENFDKSIFNNKKYMEMYSDYENISTAVNGAYLAKALSDDMIDCTPAGIYGAHEAAIYVYNNRIYLGYAANKIDSTEDQTKYNFEMTVTDLDGTIISSSPIVSVGDTVLGSIIQRCQYLTFRPEANIIHIYTDLYVTGGYKFYHTTYDTSTDTFGSFDEVTFVDDAGNTVKAEQNGEQMISGSWFTYSGHKCTAVYFNDINAGIAYSDDYTNFIFIAKLPDLNMYGAGGEMTAAYISAYNKFILAYRTPTNYGYLAYMQYDITSGSWENWKKIPDATARPFMFVYNGKTYLLNNAPYDRRNVTLWQYLDTETWNKEGYMRPVAVAKMSQPCTYFSVYVYNNEIYFAGIYNRLVKIGIAKMPIETYSTSAIDNKLLALFD